MGFALLFYLPPRWHKEQPSVLSETLQNLWGSVQATLESCLVEWVSWRIEMKEATSSCLLPLQGG